MQGGRSDNTGHIAEPEMFLVFCCCLWVGGEVACFTGRCVHYATLLVHNTLLMRTCSKNVLQHVCFCVCGLVWYSSLQGKSPLQSLTGFRSWHLQKHDACY